MEEGLLLCGVVTMMFISGSHCLGSSASVAVEVDGLVAISTTDPSYVCATLDWWPPDKCDYNQCPWGDAGLLHLDLENLAFINAIKAFGSLRIRLGGSLQDQLIYRVGVREDNCHGFRKHEEGLFGFTSGCLPMQRWDAIHNTISKTGALLTFGLNALVGRTKNLTTSGGTPLYTGNWNSNNTRQFIAYNKAKGYKVDSYELGNELCGYGVGAKVSPEQYAKDAITLKRLLKRLNPLAPPRLLAPGGFYDESSGWFKRFLNLTPPDALDIISHHVYNLGAGNDNHLIEKMQDPEFLNEGEVIYKTVNKARKGSLPKAEVWVSEAGGAYNSGRKGVSDTFVDGFWYVDQLGSASINGHSVFCRQTLVGGNYGLLDTRRFTPNPDYYSALLWHRLMGQSVLKASHSRDIQHLRVYAHCLKGHRGGVALVLINMHRNNTYNVSASVRSITRGYVTPREEYHLSPFGGNTTSPMIMLNGKLLELTSSSEIPTLTPKFVYSSPVISIMPHTIVFVALKNTRALTCF